MFTFALCTAHTLENCAKSAYRNVCYCEIFNRNVCYCGIFNGSVVKLMQFDEKLTKNTAVIKSWVLKMQSPLWKFHKIRSYVWGYVWGASKHHVCIYIFTSMLLMYVWFVYIHFLLQLIYLFIFIYVFIYCILSAKCVKPNCKRKPNQLHVCRAFQDTKIH